MPIYLKRAYEKPEQSDGYRVLIDRLWLRGIGKEELKLDEWMKEIAPLTELRQWFGHDEDKFDKFRDRYKSELDTNKDQLDKLLTLCQSHDTITLIFAAKDREHNNAVVLKEYLEEKLS